MPQLDRFLSVMVSNKADALELLEGEMATLTLGGAPRPLTKTPLTAPQLLKLVREIAPDDAGAALDAGSPATFRYTTEDGVFVAKVRQDKGRWAATLSIDQVGEFQRTTGSFVAIPGLETTGSFPVAAATPAPPPAKPAPAVVSEVPSSAAMAATRRAEANTPRLSTLTDAERVSQIEIDELLTMLVTKNASDLHLRVGEPPVLRLHGEMHRLDSKAPLENEALERMLRSIMPERNRKEYSEINDTDFAYEIPGVARFRANAMRERKGAAAVFRVIPAQVVTVEQMGISQEVQNLCYLTKGLVLVTGPTGSGKSTTLCALMDLVNRSRSDHVITIEDPIEFVHQNKNCIITQRQVGVHTGSFKHALRAALREDPDIILVGEMRDLETVSIAIETAETGHLVFGTLHTSTAPSTIDRIIDQFPADQQAQIRVMLSESLKGVVSQTLCKKIGGGRIAAREILLSIPAISNLIREGKTFQIPSIIQTSKRLGMITLNDALIDLVDQKLVEPKEAYMKSMDKMAMVNALKSHGHDVSFVEDGIAATQAVSGPGGSGSPGATARPGAPTARPGAPARR